MSDVASSAGRGPVKLEFSRMPQLRRSMPRMMLQRKPALVSAGRAVPRIEATLAGYELDGGKLLDYRKVCGFAAHPYLPITLPHVLAMPLHMEMLTHAAFPIGLLGLVHVRNEIVQHRRARVDETLDLQVVIEGHRDTERGQEFELRTYAKVDDELVWEERCTFLARDRGRARDGKPEGKGDERRGPPPLADALLTSFVAPAGIGRDYALVSGDYNPIHLAALTAKAFGFPRAIAHGMWLLGRIAAELEPRWPKGRTRYEAQFRQPVLLPAWVMLANRAQEGRIDFELRDDSGERLHLGGAVAPAD